MHLDFLLDYPFGALVSLFINIDPYGQLIILFAGLGKLRASVYVTAFIINKFKLFIIIN